MAANTGIIEGQDLVLYVSGSAVAHSTTCTLSPTVETRERISKDTGKYKTKVAGLIDWEVSADALACYGTTNYMALYLLMIARTPLAVKFQGRAAVDALDNWIPEATGDKYYTGNAIITSMPMTAPNNADATFSITLSGTGTLTQATK
jgi:predicted secreted protein